MATTGAGKILPLSATNRSRNVQEQPMSNLLFILGAYLTGVLVGAWLQRNHPITPNKQ